MSLPVVLGAGALGGLGAVARFLLDHALTRRLRHPFPFGTLVVNLSGAFVLGILAGAALHGDAAKLWGTGLLGGYTTFSTWMLEAERLDDHGHRGLTGVNVAGSLVAGVLAAWLGRTLAG